MNDRSETGPVERVRRSARPLSDGARDYDPLMDAVGPAHLVLLGAATHGTREFYRERGVITRRLIEEKGFAGVAVEADWPEARRVHRYAEGAGADADAVRALGGFQRFPAWLWRNAEVAAFVEWLKTHNDALPAGSRKVGFYGIDLYSFRASMAAVLAYLEKIDPRAAERARAGYACFDEYGENLRAYSLLMASELAPSCKAGAAIGLTEIYESRAAKQARRGGGGAEEEFFDAEQNARVVKNAEEYFRHMIRNEASAWNARERHMAETIDDLMTRLDPRSGRGKLVVWAHNSHVGDARATEMHADRELSVGRLMRERHAGDVALVGLATHHGAVLASSGWDQPGESKPVPPALPGSYEALFHATELPRFLLVCRRREGALDALRGPRRERAIGVVYRADAPETERASHYLEARLPRQFDAVLYFDETGAVEPLAGFAERSESEVPQTYPFGV